MSENQSVIIPPDVVIGTTIASHTDSIPNNQNIFASSASRVGRPTIYSEELVEYICNLISTETRGVRRLCREDKGMPAFSSIQLWRKLYPSFSAKYNEAKLLQQALLAEQLNFIVEEALNEYGYDENGSRKIDPSIASLLKMQAD